MHERIRDFFRWYCAPAGPIPTSFAADFVMDHGLTTYDAESWLWYVRQNVHRDVTLLAIEAGESGGAIVFSATDPVTLLRHRVAWVVSWSGGSLSRILSTHMSVAAPQGNATKQ